MNVLHIYATNKQVYDYNSNMLNSICQKAVTIEAQDFERNPKTGRMERKNGHHTKVFNTCLQPSVCLGIQARIMLTKNIDVSDGLVNGAFGIVVQIIYDTDKDFPSLIHAEFDDSKIGQQQRTKMHKPSNTTQNITIIKPEEEKVSNCDVLVIALTHHTSRGCYAMFNCRFMHEEINQCRTITKCGRSSLKVVLHTDAK